MICQACPQLAWNQLVQFTDYKAANAGRKCIQVNPRNTSKACSSCGQIVEKDLSVRIHSCPNCDLMLDRDHNAAINILALGLQSIPQSRIEAAPL
jgi:putative transposase